MTGFGGYAQSGLLAEITPDQSVPGQTLSVPPGMRFAINGKLIALPESQSKPCP
ncbi:Uncharacterised protein [Klebsiella pneumoniae]|uniref:Uncharacterized protein n=1 Tax=Klebsiella pneumoniae TaxID=573 RepID=A0A2X3HLG5_KLEPN|nr:Uncharacterised protein [Klebsiella pneumoniae]